MSEQIPLNILRPRILAEVPVSEYSDLAKPTQLHQAEKRRSFISLLRSGSAPKTPAAQNSTQKCVYEFNVAAWIRVSRSEKQVFSLVLCFEDAKGERAVLVDEAEISANYSLMLAGKAEIKSHGPLKSLRVGCVGLRPDQRPIIDELHVQRIQNQMTTAVQTRIA
ncbi:MAG: hypothetical protein H6999_07465 [Hahellaceae bacterium]|nr:hypothetical protein [Hahellaceae bacterium]